MLMQLNIRCYSYPVNKQVYRCACFDSVRVKVVGGIGCKGSCQGKARCDGSEVAFDGQ